MIEPSIAAVLVAALAWDFGRRMLQGEARKLNERVEQLEARPTGEDDIRELRADLVKVKQRLDMQQATRAAAPAPIEPMRVQWAKRR